MKSRYKIIIGILVIITVSVIAYGIFTIDSEPRLKTPFVWK